MRQGSTRKEKYRSVFIYLPQLSAEVHPGRVLKSVIEQVEIEVLAARGLFYAFKARLSRRHSKARFLQHECRQHSGVVVVLAIEDVAQLYAHRLPTFFLVAFWGISSPDSAKSLTT